ncbi:sensor domain-containing diguanylate cyclase [Erythrobacter sp. THAF29]|uniref:sensor domain-containing diguanylate cyclase n=1 Tax=Erythrobacter sp. THAF29 TaxID=2587851 RepID=UPI001561D263|nr:sensor domain-containing diguanylate cyclase [Erythrobacter sp. THAF29]
MGTAGIGLPVMLSNETILASVCLALALVSLVLLAALVAARRDTRFVAELARKRAARINEFVRTACLAEEIAGIGIWECDPATGRQQWSDGLRKIFGVEGDEPLVDGDAETMLFANNIDLVHAVRERLDKDGPYQLHYELYGFDGELRSIEVKACNLKSQSGGTDRVVAVVRDDTDRIERVRELEFSRAAAVREASRARELAATDPLTGLANRRSAMERLDSLIVDARRSTMPLVLVVFDIDHFKSVNDTYGHVEGDKVLKKVAQIAQDQAREDDVIGRVGGEEFIWVVPGATETIARVMSERLRLAIAEGSSTDKVPAVTISAGIAELDPQDTSLTLFARADSALYAAKSKGRNRVQLAA